MPAPPPFCFYPPPLQLVEPTLKDGKLQLFSLEAVRTHVWGGLQAVQVTYKHA